ncbi:MAG TPA: carbonic anhydrase [Bdellovibrio sp.]|uniref:carbonic anhydrase n=1 Tax=Bdellovibrio sp. TaxID=28201 RepID=UPI002EED265F
MVIRVALILALVNLSACSYFSKRRSNTEAPKEASVQMTPTTVPAAKEGAPVAKTEGQAQAQEVKNAVAEAAQHIKETHGKPVREAGPVPAEKAYGWLRNGNTRFVKGFFRKDGALAKDRLRVAAGQTPHSVVLSSSDSSAPPEVIFDQKLGELYTVRTAGPSLSENVIGSIEYAVANLGVNLIVVMGQENSGAVKATLQAMDGADVGSPSFGAVVNDLKPRLLKYKGIKPSPAMIEESWSNVDGIAKDLLLRSEILRDAVTSGEVKIVRGMYHLESGNVEFK